MKCGLARDNVDQASELISEGNALLKITVYPWGAEFDLVQKSSGGENLEDDSNGGM